MALTEQNRLLRKQAHPSREGLEDCQSALNFCGCKGLDDPR